MVKAFKGTVHVFILNGKERKVIDPNTIPLDIKNELCSRKDYWLPSIAGPNHDVAHFDISRQNWRDMRNATLKHTFRNQPITYNGTNLAWP